MSKVAWIAVAAVVLSAVPALAATKTGTILEGAENLKTYRFSVVAGTAEIVVPQVITLSWDVPGTAMIAIMSCRETGTTEEYDTHGSGFGEDHFLRMEVALNSFSTARPTPVCRHPRRRVR